MMFLLRRKRHICGIFCSTLYKASLSSCKCNPSFYIFLHGFFFFNSSHPYIFFNQDRVTMTFVGFHIDQNGNLIDPDRRVIIKPSLMSRHLRTGLFVQKVDMETNYESWSKYEIYIYFFDMVFVDFDSSVPSFLPRVSLYHGGIMLMPCFC